MSTFSNQPPLDQFPQDLQQRKQQQQQQLFPFDFFYPSQTQDIIAPHPDSFELDLDLSLASEEPGAYQLYNVDPNPAFNFVRSETPKCGPPSTFTVSSESTYESLSSRSESLYRSNFSQSSYAASDFSFPLDMDFDRIRIDTMSDYGSVAQPTAAELEAAVEAAGFGLPPTPPYSPDEPRRECFSDYEPASYSLSGGVAPSNMSHSTSPVSSHSQDSEDKADPRKKYKCNVCPRAFARAYNLKTHMATHDPNRLKPHVCPHGACGRSFSRKHDLGRHLISIHREEQDDRKAIGIQKGRRVWCDQCGKSSDGEVDCDCSQT